MKTKANDAEATGLWEQHGLSPITAWWNVGPRKDCGSWSSKVGCVLGQAAQSIKMRHRSAIVPPLPASAQLWCLHTKEDFAGMGGRGEGFQQVQIFFTLASATMFSPMPLSETGPLPSSIIRLLTACHGTRVICATHSTCNSTTYNRLILCIFHAGSVLCSTWLCALDVDLPDCLQMCATSARGGASDRYSSAKEPALERFCWQELCYCILYLP